ncbi:copine-8-like protein [Leptotrombidium deliense]|uniref:Copine-8-like protein n=1 Tax=Leptotrombidium deliense TaxID=299467 RepID=A0A443SPA8_9ACAR|nr:copine-8-like protein [Leptotrombidium deliense]
MFATKNEAFDLSVSAKGLSGRDVLSNSDPQCIVYVREAGNWSEVGRSEVVSDNNNPDWIKRFSFHHNPNVSQELKFEVFDYDPASGNDFLGRVETTLAVILGAGVSGYRAPLIGGGFSGKSRTGGELQIRAEKSSGLSNQKVTFQFCGENIESKDFIGKSDPYLVISRCLPDGSFAVCHRTEHAKNTKKPVWNAFTVDVNSLCNGDWDRIIKFECFDWDDDSEHDFIGSCTTTLKKLSEGPSHGNIFELVNPRKVGKKNYSNSGFLKLMSYSIVGSAPMKDKTAKQQPMGVPNTGYPAATYPPQQAYPSAGYPPTTNYPANTYPSSNYQATAGYPPQQPNPYAASAGYPPNTGYPSNVGFAPPNPGYPPATQGYPPNPGYPQNPGYPPNTGYAPTAGYPPMPTSYPPAPGMPGFTGSQAPPSYPGYPPTQYPPYQ